MTSPSSPVSAAAEQKHEHKNDQDQFHNKLHCFLICPGSGIPYQYNGFVDVLFPLDEIRRTYANARLRWRSRSVSNGFDFARRILRSREAHEVLRL
jgi:hypothetical protein